jgi:hypothetical protein
MARIRLAEAASANLGWPLHVVSRRQATPSHLERTAALSSALERTLAAAA